jgi:hypothetical protein
MCSSRCSMPLTHSCSGHVRLASRRRDSMWAKTSMCIINLRGRCVAESGGDPGRVEGFVGSLVYDPCVIWGGESERDDCQCLCSTRRMGSSYECVSSPWRSHITISSSVSTPCQLAASTSWTTSRCEGGSAAARTEGWMEGRTVDIMLDLYNDIFPMPWRKLGRAVARQHNDRSTASGCLTGPTRLYPFACLSDVMRRAFPIYISRPSDRQPTPIGATR